MINAGLSKLILPPVSRFVFKSVKNPEGDLADQVYHCLQKQM